MRGLEALLLERPGVEALGAGIIAQEFVVPDDMGDLAPLAATQQTNFLKDSVPPTGNATVEAFNSAPATDEDAFQSYLEDNK